MERLPDMRTALHRIAFALVRCGRVASQRAFVRMAAAERRWLVRMAPAPAAVPIREIGPDAIRTAVLSAMERAGRGRTAPAAGRFQARPR